jgi:hypothetical protein
VTYVGADFGDFEPILGPLCRFLRVVRVVKTQTPGKLGEILESWLHHPAHPADSGTASGSATTTVSGKALSELASGGLGRKM